MPSAKNRARTTPALRPQSRSAPRLTVWPPVRRGTCQSRFTPPAPCAISPPSEPPIHSVCSDPIFHVHSHKITKPPIPDTSANGPISTIHSLLRTHSPNPSAQNPAHQGRLNLYKGRGPQEQTPRKSNVDAGWGKSPHTLATSISSPATDIHRMHATRSCVAAPPT